MSFEYECDDKLKKTLTIEPKNSITKIQPVLLYKDNKIPFYTGIKKQLYHKHKTLESNNIHNIELRENEIYDQKTVVNSAIKLLKSQKCVQLALHTGFGKSLIATYLACKTKKKTLVIVDRREVLKGWLNTWKQYINVKFKHLKSSNNELDSDFYITTFQTLRSSKFNINYAYFGTIIVDENILMCTQNRCNTIMKFKPSYMIGCCADTFKINGLHSILYYFFGPRGNFIKRSLKKNIFLLKLNTNFNPKIEDKEMIKMLKKYRYMNEKMRMMQERRMLYQKLSNIEERNNMISDYIKLFSFRKMIVFTEYVNHAKNLYELCCDKKVNCTLFVGNMKSIEDSNVLITTSSKCGRGFDLSKAVNNFDGREFDIVMYAYPCSNPEQSSGRSRDKNKVSIIYFVDNHPKVKRDFDKTFKWCKSKITKSNRLNFIEDWV